MLTTRTKHENRLEKKVPNVFERLSKQQHNKMNTFHSPVKSANDSNKFKSMQDSNYKSVPKTGVVNGKRVSQPRRKTQINLSSQNRTESTCEGAKKDVDCDSFHEKVLMENVPETTDKDINEIISDSCDVSHEPLGDNKDVIGDLSRNEVDYVISNEIVMSPLETFVECNNSVYSKPKNFSTDVSAKFPSFLCSNTPLSTQAQIYLTESVVSDSVINDTSKHQRDIAPLKCSSELLLQNLKSKLNCYKQFEYNTDKNIVKKSKNTTVVDDDKDLCDAESEQDEEFYKVKVQTRLVSYENSTLFIRNTSKQSLDSHSESDCSSQSESLSSASPHSSHIEEPTSLETPVTHFSQEESSEEQSKLNVKSKLGQLMTKGKAILNEVYNSYYVPDVKNTFNKFQGITGRSLKSLTFPSIRRREVASDKKHDADSGFSSLTSAEENNLPNDKSIFEDHPIIYADNDRTTHDPGTLTGINDSKVTLNTEAECSLNENTSLGQDTAQDDVRPDFSDFFHSCSCEQGESASRAPGQCSCQEMSEFPLEIKELLDADYARMWWTITGNFGNILPIDWSKTYTRQKYLPVLNLNETKKLEGNVDSVTPSPREDDEDEVAHDLDLHQLILAGTQQDTDPVKSAEEVIKEIDDIMQEGSSSEDEGIDATSSGSKDSVRSELQQLPPPLYRDKLKDLSVTELNETLMELEVVIRRYSETLISQLAHRDELEYEKELKNTFISLLLQVQNKRRNYNLEKKKVKKPIGPNGTDLKYLTTVIPYDVGHGPPDNETIQILIKILRAINDDSPTVPTLLTDYILRVLCPS